MSYSFRVTFNDQGQAIVTNTSGEPPTDGAYFYVSGHGAQSLGVSLQGADGATVMQAGAYCPAAHLPEPAPTPAPDPAPAPTPAPPEAAPTVPDPIPAEMQAAYPPGPSYPAPSSPPAYPSNPAADPTSGGF